LVWNIGEKNYRTIFFSRRLNGLVYLSFLQNILPILLEEMDLHRRQNMWLPKDSAPPYFYTDERRYLDTVYANKRISLDITPLDCFLWGMLKERVFQTLINSREDLDHRITVACRSVTPAMFIRLRGSFRNRMDACERNGGQNFDISLIDSLNFTLCSLLKHLLRWYFS
jgi:hypothetical protein